MRGFGVVFTQKNPSNPCVTATGGINLIRLYSLENCRLVNIAFFPRSHECEYPMSLRGRPRDHTVGESYTNFKQEYVPNSGTQTLASVFDSTKPFASYELGLSFDVFPSLAPKKSKPSYAL